MLLCEVRNRGQKSKKRTVFARKQPIQFYNEATARAKGFCTLTPYSTDNPMNRTTDLAYTLLDLANQFCNRQADRPDAVALGERMREAAELVRSHSDESYESVLAHLRAWTSDNKHTSTAANYFADRLEGVIDTVEHREHLRSMSGAASTFTRC